MCDKKYHLRRVSLATIGVCVFSAAASVVALFYFIGEETKWKEKNKEKE